MNKKMLSLIVILTASLVPLAIVNVADDADTSENLGDTVYNKEMTDWWDELVDSLGDKSGVVWSDPGWGNDIWVEVEDMGKDTYRILLFGITESGAPITYTITETKDGYYKNGPALPDGKMDSRTYVREGGLLKIANP